MLETLTLINFRQHTDLTVNFTPGLNVIRGNNEVGKSTILEAIAYAFYGARQLRESIDETVTWGQTPSSLRVELRFTFDGVPGFVRRSKSGAEVKYGETIASGQEEVSKFFHRLFQVDAKQAANLQIASQNKVRGALEGNSAVALIESLADFSLLETLVDKIQQLKPCGNTNLVSDRLARLKAAATAELPVMPAESAVTAAGVAALAAQSELDAARNRLQTAQEGVPAAQTTIRAAEALEAEQRAARRRLDQIAPGLLARPPELIGTPEEIAAWRTAAQAEKDRARLYKLYTQATPWCSFTWQGGYDALLEKLEQVKAAVKLSRKTVTDLKLSRVSKLAMRINDKTCALCKKDLSDVPEVTSINDEIDEAAKRMSEAISLEEDRLHNLEAEQCQLEEARDASNNYLSLFPAEHWDYDESTMPPKVSWKGEAPSAEPDPVDTEGLARSAEARLQERAAAQARLETLQAERDQIDTKLREPHIDTEAAKAVVDAADEAREAVNKAQLAQAKAVSDLKAAEQAYNHAVELRNMAIVAAEKAAKDISSTEQELQDMSFYNELIKKIRSARPAVANKLWALVTAAVSHYTTHGRGEPSTVSRDGDGFKINGKAAAAYSGSAQDVLGLSIRLALVKTFLPNSPFMIMDEIAAACDDERELDMLGMVLAADIPQVLLVTHSDAAESFAANLVQL